METGKERARSKLSTGYCQLDRVGADLGRRVTKSSQAAVAAFHSLKERSRNSR